MSVVRLQSNVDPYLFDMLEAEEEGGLLDSFMTPRASIGDRIEAGRALRKRVPRGAHASLVVNVNRPDPVAILEQQNATRVQKLVPIRYGRMLASPFAFLRGSAAVMASDLSSLPVTGLRVAACGDMHVQNFGLYGSAERNLVFSINDFDEVYVGPWEWDLKRLASSAAVAVLELGGKRTQAEEVARDCVRSYREHIHRYAQMGHLAVWYERIDEDSILASVSPDMRTSARRFLEKARSRVHLRALERLTERVHGQQRFIEDAPLIVRETHTDDGIPVMVALDRVLRAYIDSLSYDRRRLLARYQIVDVVRKVVGVGSVGTSCWVILLQGASEDDPLFLQVKEAKPSVLAPYVDLELPFANQGRRVVACQRLIQGSPDIFLGWGEIGGMQYYVRQLTDMKGGAKIDDLDALPDYCWLCGGALALAHAKSGDAAMIAGYCGSSEALDEAIGEFSLGYARQTEQDFEALRQAKRAGRIEADWTESET